jgi:hypothetical protein
MEKYLVAIEFRYSDAPKFENDSGTSNSKTITIGVYDNFDEAIEKGNKALEKLESKFAIHTFPDGRKATKERFSKNGGCFGTANKLVTDLAYLKTPFSFYAKITTLKHLDLDEAIFDLIEARNRYVSFREKELD